jgi:hypothetical protein
VAVENHTQQETSFTLALELDADFADWGEAAGIYPRANSPQSWSSSAVVMLVRAMLGIAPYAPLDVLLVDPHLPEWLPEVTLHGLHVGTSTVTLRFSRTAGGETGFEVLEALGPLRVVRDVGVLGAFSRVERARAALARR